MGGPRINFHEADKALARELLANCPTPRDRLPYTAEFDALLAVFNSRTGRAMQPDVFWRLLSTSAKKGGLAKKRNPSA